jgi:hypothetical protein
MIGLRRICPGIRRGFGIYGLMTDYQLWLWSGVGTYDTGFEHRLVDDEHVPS